MDEMPSQSPKIEDPQAKPAASQPTTPSTDGGYGKKGSVWKWIIIYVVIAVVVYGVIYYFAKNRGGSYGGSATSSTGY